MGGEYIFKWITGYLTTGTALPIKLISASDFHLEPKLALQSSSEETVQQDAGWVLLSVPAWLPI